MHWAIRWQAGPALERRLETQVAELAESHPRGFVVRLHVLGDFYSPEYVALWRSLLVAVPALHIWVFTACWNVDDVRLNGMGQTAGPIAAALAALIADYQPARLMALLSDGPRPRSAIVVETPEAAPAGSVVCPYDIGTRPSCCDCGICLAKIKKLILALIQH